MTRLLKACWLRWVRHRAPHRQWERGTCKGVRARRHKKTGEVQFILWRKGEHGHRKDYWHQFDWSWWPGFEPARKRFPS